ncbi:hypothetical protein ACFL0Q_06860 [Thermodesulfobacteriota bacterium]
MAIALAKSFARGSVENRFQNSLTLPRHFRVVMDFLRLHPSRNILIITDRPGLYAAQDYGAVNFLHANGHKESLCRELSRHLYEEIYVVQEVPYDTKEPANGQQLDQYYGLETVYELQNRAETFIRISRVKKTRIEELSAGQGTENTGPKDGRPKQEQ